MSSIVQHAPRFNEQDAIRLALELFGLEASSRQLPSERDQNFHLTASDGKAYVLKLANSTEGREVLDFQNQAMVHIAGKRNLFAGNAAVVPDLVPTTRDEQIATVKCSEGTSHFVRLLTYLPGKPLALVKPHDVDLLASLGRFFGTIDQALQDFDHSATHRDFHWDLQNAGQIITGYQQYMHIPEDRRLVKALLKRFQANTEPQMADLRSGVIHNDANDYNVLVEPHGNRGNTVTGVIDFGDMVYTRIVCEVAIACAYAMLGKADPLTVAGNVIGGYHQSFPLTEQELMVLFDLICMRLCMSVCHAANQSRQEPDNAYLRISEQPAWGLLHKLANIHPRLAHYTFRNACGLPPVPQTPGIVKWLQSHASQCASLIDGRLEDPPPLVFDLSVGSLLLGGDGAGADTEAVTKTLFGQIQAAEAKVGIGRYNEARLIYTARHFEVQTEEMPETRTVHLGLDLYLPPSSRVYAPLKGRVHSFNNNRAPLDYGPTIIIEHQTDDGQKFYTLYGHLRPDSLDGLQVGMQVAKGQPIARVGDADVNGGWPPHLHFQLITDMLGEQGNFPGAARPSQRAMWLDISPDPNIILGIPPACFPAEGRSRDEILALRRQKLGRNLSIAYHRPLKIVRGRGQYLYTEEGQAYLDGVNNVCHVGHCHPRVVAAGQLQMPVLNTNTRYLHDYIIAYAQRLLSKFPDPLSVCYFVCTGSEANELALRMARNYTGQREIVTVDGAYHGNTQALIDISPYKHDGPGGRGTPPGVHKVVMPDGYRGPHKGSGPDVGTRYAQYVREAVDRAQAGDNRPAAFICESMLGCGGQIVLPDNYLAEAFKHVRAAGGVCIIDEVQVGFGRVGTHLWAFETQNVVPDIVTLGKPIGNGHPLAAVITTPEIADAFANGMEYFNTFGGNPVSCAIGMAVMDVIENEGLQENARLAGQRLLSGLKGLMDKYPLIGDVRGLGLYVGIELVVDRSTLEPATEHADYIINRMRDHGILISTDGPLENVLKMKPPIVFSEKNADEVVIALDKILQEDCLQV
ncbi:MAG: aminotransferase class III-fold pyridoxal phosphate-dependent enzyme [Deltaproteobacteria bacterium]|jgi:4-aminobutyrate aminotransferase-like enzyme/Ser/Thr protein kinase RdoA (MazF antagonist)|nr:aminotransferase class III-fold pyridoxal phosphate-dependent enzyme [Deltaproteobacteria bacterium]